MSIETIISPPPPPLSSDAVPLIKRPASRAHWAMTKGPEMTRLTLARAEGSSGRDMRSAGPTSAQASAGSKPAAAGSSPRWSAKDSRREPGPASTNVLG